MLRRLLEGKALNRCDAHSTLLMELGILTFSCFSLSKRQRAVSKLAPPELAPGRVREIISCCCDKSFGRKRILICVVLKPKLIARELKTFLLLKALRAFVCRYQHKWKSFSTPLTPEMEEFSFPFFLSRQNRNHFSCETFARVLFAM